MKDTESNYLANLRQRAKVWVQATQENSLRLSAEEAQELLEELRLHQAELQLQNEDLLQFQRQLEISREEYRALYELAPVGYFILDEETLILRANVVGADQLNSTPSELLRQPFTAYIERESQDTFYHHRRQLLKSKRQAACELQMVKGGGGLFFAHLETVLLSAEGQAGQFLVTLIDITERKRVEQENETLLGVLRQKSEQVQALGRRLAAVREQEQQKLARELHDRLGQNLTALDFHLDYLKTQLADLLPEADSLQTHLKTSQELVQEAVEQVRDVLAELRPPVLDDYGLAVALEWYADRLSRGRDLQIKIQGEALNPRPVPHIENTLLRIAQEALTNIIKHAQATKIIISLESYKDTVQLEIIDNGIGLELSRQKHPNSHKSWGLLIMAERAEMIGGLCRIESEPGQGTRVTVEAPTGL